NTNTENTNTENTNTENTNTENTNTENTNTENTNTENTNTENTNTENTNTENTNTENTNTENTNNRVTNINEVPSKLTNSIFLLNNDNQPVYDANNPIPTIDKMPEGLVFKVQIGAFRNPIPQNHFKGFAPIMAEDAGNGITRYTAGLFTGINTAVEAKNSIRSIGYNDAFVVAFYNGERISIAKAREMMGEELVVDNSSNENNNSTENTSTENTNTVENNSNNEQPVTNNQPQTEEVKDGVSTDVRNIDGVFYAIQVGVYSKPVTAGQLNNVSPLNSERLANGLIRYTSGVYKNINDANSAKDRIRGIGITDAFVVAYNGGQKITVAKANEMLADNTDNNTSNETSPGLVTPEDIEDNEEENNTTENEVDNTNTEEENNEEETSDNNELDNDNIEDDSNEDEVIDTEPITTAPETLNLEFKVKLGEYEEDVPVEDAALFLKLTGRGVKNYEENGKTIYTIGSFTDYQTALDMQIEMKEEGIESPTTIVFRDGKEIPLEEALELIKNNQ
ncbi:MAG: SPOR domain-containing protein, partial [Vicingaceae bacterium]|nr:SPOR domain-containing protein [Vicingaceae bacterium]